MPYRKNIHSLGGFQRARSLSKSERKKIASKAATVRWRDPCKVIKDVTFLKGFCDKYEIMELYVFGSILRPDFSRQSDVDFLYVCETRMGYSRYCDAVDELKSVLGRDVDLIEKSVIESSTNPYRRHEILSTAQMIHAKAH